jgi:hypothetical protein
MPTQGSQRGKKISDAIKTIDCAAGDWIELQKGTIKRETHGASIISTDGRQPSSLARSQHPV